MMKRRNPRRTHGVSSAFCPVLLTRHLPLLITIGALVVAAPLSAAIRTFGQGFESGFTLDATVGSHTDWFDGGTGPTVIEGTGAGASVGLVPSGGIFHWTAHAFDWNDPAFVAVVLQLDIQANTVGWFDNDRVGWTIDPTSTSQSDVFGIQLDPGGTGLNIEGFWEGQSLPAHPSIVSVATLTPDAWYRLSARITKLTATSARIDVTLTALNVAGEPGAVVASASLADTSTLSGDAPDAKYFSAPALYPSFRNYHITTGAADNAYVEIIDNTPEQSLFAPSSPFAEVVSPTQIRLTWSDESANETGFEIERAIGSGPSVLRAVVPADATSFTDTVLEAGTEYCYRLRAVQRVGVEPPRFSAYAFPLVCATTPERFPFVAYNDCVHDAAKVATGTDPNGQSVLYIAPNVTTFGIGNGHVGPAYGGLLDLATGEPTGVMVTLTQIGNVLWFADVSPDWYGGYDTADGTDAHLTFGGIADMTGSIAFGTAGWHVDATFTGLDPARRYAFATSASRAKRTTDGEPGFTGYDTLYTLSGVDAACNASTPGTGILNGDPLTVWFNTGNNHEEGYVARWRCIQPGSDGSFAVRAEAHPDAVDGRRAYAFDVFMLKEEILVPPDFDEDCDVDTDDFDAFVACQTGPDVPYNPQNLPVGCALALDDEDILAADFDRDGDLDQTDFAAFQRCFSGQNHPADEGCAD